MTSTRKAICVDEFNSNGKVWKKGLKDVAWAFKGPGLLAQN